MKTLKTILEIALLLAVLYAGYYIFLRPSPPPPPPITVTETVTETDTVYVSVFVSKPAVIDTVYVPVDDGLTIKDVRASVDTTFTGEFYSVSLEIEYWIKREFFDIRADIEVVESTIYITNTITHIKQPKTAFLRPFVGAMAFRHPDGNFGLLSAGVCVMDRVDISFGVTSDAGVGVGLSYRW